MEILRHHGKQFLASSFFCLRAESTAGVGSTVHEGKLLGGPP